MKLALLVGAFGIGFVAGLRSLMAPAVVCWAAALGWLNLSGTPFAFMGSGFTRAIVTILALGELVADKLPKTPNRTARGPLLARCLMGGLSGACLFASAQQPVSVGLLLGIVGAITGAFAGYQARMRLVKRLGVRDIYVAVPEDLITIGLGLLFVCLARS
jgi:uncharacterized membrane protein